MRLPPLQPSDGALLRCLLLAAPGKSLAEFIYFSMHRLWSLQNSGSTYQLSFWEVLGRSLPLLEPQTPCLGNRCNTGSAIVSQMSKHTYRAPGTWLAPSGLKGLLWWLGRGGVVCGIHLVLGPAMALTWRLETWVVPDRHPCLRYLLAVSQLLCLCTGDGAAGLAIRIGLFSLQRIIIFSPPNRTLEWALPQSFYR